MSRTTLYRVGLALTLAAVLSLSAEPTWARGGGASRPHTAPAKVQPAGPLTQALNHLLSIWAKAGSVIDPNGYMPASTNNAGTSISTQPTH